MNLDFLRKRTLLGRLLLLILPITVLPLLVVGLFIISKVENELRRSVLADLSTKASSIAERVDALYLGKWLDALKLTEVATANRSFRQSLKLLYAKYDNFEQIQTIELYQKNLSGSGWTNAGYLLKRKQGFLWEEKQRLIESMPEGETKVSFTALVYNPAGGTPYLLLGYPVRGFEASPRVLVATISLEKLRQDLRRQILPRETMYLIDSQGRYVAFSTPGEFEPIRKQVPTDIFNEISWTEAGGGARYFKRFEADTEIWGSYALTKEARWAVVVEQPKSEGLSAVAQIKGSVYGLIVFVFLTAVFGSLYFSRKITGPIKNFAKSATEIARGNFEQRVRVESDDEIGRLARIFNYMTIELKRLNDMNLSKIISEKSKTETIIRNIADGVIVTDPSNRILVLNSAAERWFGVSEKTVYEHPIEECIKNDKLIALLEEVRACPDENTFAKEISLKKPGQWKELILQAKAAKVNDERGELIGVVTILRDVTKEREVDRMKTELVSMVAHELRSPLTSISGFSELLLDPDLGDEKAFEYAEIVKRESDRLADLVNKFLDISKIESGKSEVKKVPIRINVIIERVLANNSSLAENKGIKLISNLPPDVSVIYADEDMIGQVILNLFSNAVKYSPPNTQVEFNVIEREDDILVEVVDQGYGIPQKDLPFIFDKFYRVRDVPELREAEGSGLGLSLAKQIVELHGGTIWVESHSQQGSIFRFTLPKDMPPGWAGGQGEDEQQRVEDLQELVTRG